MGAWKSEVPKRMSFEAADICSRDFFSSGFCCERVCVLTKFGAFGGRRRR